MSERQEILENLAGARAGVIPRRDLDFAQHVMRIPMQDYRAICMLYPLNARDRIEREDAWKRFEKSALSEPYRVNRRVNGVQKK
jgi:hypothetical protein